MKTSIKISDITYALTDAVSNIFTAKKKSLSGDPMYIEKIAKQSFWSNKPENSIPECRIYNHIHLFLDECVMQNSKMISTDGKIRKVLFLGFDGMRVDVLPHLIGDANNAKTNVSGIADVLKKGNIYFAYCGGEKGTETQETTSTSASWTSQLTGVWGSRHGIKTNEDTKNLLNKTYVLEYAEKGLHTSLGFAWDQCFDVNLKEEVKYVMKNGLPLTFCDIDRPKRNDLKKTRAESIELYNFVAPKKPAAADPVDTGMRDWVIERIEADDDIVCGIFDGIDAAGHSYGFGTSEEYFAAAVNCDMYAKSILNLIKKRERYNNEEWLVVFANDHGGIGKGHGGQSLEERTTWIATNRPFDLG